MSEASRAWSWRHAFSSSDLPATTKHVLHTLGMFMNELGEGCYPSVADICRYSGLDKKTVLKHLAAAREAGWIGISQHGYRGQKWKRNEYAARWPERDLTAPCPPEGGGAVPPASQGAKVVDSVPQGGGTEGPKVVEEVHQDKTSPETTPNTSPVEREARESEREEGQPDEAEKPEGLTKRAEALFYRAFTSWDRFAVSPKKPMLAAWSRLTWTQMQAAADAVPRFLAAKRAAGMKHAPAIAKFLDLDERLWEQFPASADQQPAYVEARPWGKGWAAAVFKRLLAGREPQAAIPGLTAIERMRVREGSADEMAIMRRNIARCGYPSVNRLYDLASHGRSVTVSADVDALGEAMEQVRVASDIWHSWEAEFERRAWPWMPDPGKQEWVYFPRGGPAELAAFEELIRNATQSEAAE